MRAVVVDDFTTPEALRVRETDAPSLAENEVRIEVRAAGCNFCAIFCSVTGPSRTMAIIPTLSFAVRTTFRPLT